jgi:hypothetical protein
LPQSRHKTMKKNNMIKSTKKKETMKKIKSKQSNLLNYFICDHKDLKESYLESCEQFLKSDLFKSNDLESVNDLGQALTTKRLSW